MPKNIVLFIDGTWNEAGDAAKGENTNVHKLFLAADGQPDQVCKYLNGIGTDRAGRWLRRLPHFPRNIVGGLFGLGMSDRIKDAYHFLSKEYERGDSVFLFGFSRGAFAARSVAGFVDAVGLLLKTVAHNENLIEEAYATYENSDDPTHLPLRRFLRRLNFAARPSADDWDCPSHLFPRCLGHRRRARVTKSHRPILSPFHRIPHDGTPRECTIRSSRPSAARVAWGVSSPALAG